MKSRRPLLILFILLLAASLIWALMPKPVEVDVGTITSGPMEVTVRENGKTRIKDRYVVAAPLAGKLERIRLRSGDSVQADKDSLAVIVPSDPDLLDPRARAQAEAKVRAAEALKSQVEAQLQKAKVDQNYAKTNLDRAKRVFAADALSHEAMDVAEQQMLLAESGLKSAEFAAQVAGFELEQAQAVLLRASGDSGQNEWRHEITAPISGRVLRVFQESSTVVVAGTKLVELGNPADMELEVDVLSTDGVRIQPGARVSIEHWGGAHPLKGRVRLVEPAGFTKVSALGVEEQRVNVIIDFTDPPNLRSSLGDAFSVEASIVLWESDNTLRVPVAALFRVGSQWAVFVVEDGTAVQRLVEIGRSNDQYGEVLIGVKQGEQVILYPSDRVEKSVHVRERETHSTFSTNS